MLSVCDVVYLTVCMSALLCFTCSCTTCDMSNCTATSIFPTEPESKLTSVDMKLRCNFWATCEYYQLGPAGKFRVNSAVFGGVLRGSHSNIFISVFRRRGKNDTIPLTTTSVRFSAPLLRIQEGLNHMLLRRCAHLAMFHPWKSSPKGPNPQLRPKQSANLI